MSFTIEILGERAITTFSNSVEENEIKNAFIKITEIASIEKLNYIIFNFTDITSYTIPKDYMNIVKIVTHFSSEWNKDIKALTVATHPNIRAITTEIIKHNNELNWEYLLFDNLVDAYNWCSEN